VSNAPFGLSLSKPAHPYVDDVVRRSLVDAVLLWERTYGVAPQGVTGAIAEFDAAMLVGHTPQTYSEEMHGATAVRKGFDFCHSGERYQVKGNRPSGKPGSFITRAGKPTNLDWDTYVWIRYDEHYLVVEAWSWDNATYSQKLDHLARLSPSDIRSGVRLA
jgi:hypothetical protein